MIHTSAHGLFGELGLGDRPGERIGRPKSPAPNTVFRDFNSQLQFSIVSLVQSRIIHCITPSMALITSCRQRRELRLRLTNQSSQGFPSWDEREGERYSDEM